MNLLKAKMMECECTMCDLSDRIGVHVSTLYRKMREPKTLQLWELKKIMSALEMSREQMIDIFFDD